MTDNKNERHTYSSLKGFHRAIPIIIYAVAVFMAVCFITGEAGAVGNAVSKALLGLFSYGAYFVPVLLALHGLFYPADLKERRIVSRFIFSLIALITVSALIYAIDTWGTDSSEIVFSAKESYRNGTEGIGGGFVGSAIAFCLIKAFDYVGLVIIAIAIFAIYLSFFFSGGQRTLGKVMLGALRGILVFLVFIEKKIKQFFALFKNGKKKKEEKRLTERNEALGDDDFFAVDNGMQKLEIAGLGIAEERSKKTLEERPTLSDKVHHKSERKSDGYFEERSTANTYFAEEAPKPRKIATERDIEIEQDGPVFRNEETFSTEADSPFCVQNDEQTADSVFENADFDPFSVALNEALRDKRSGKGPVASVNEDTFSYGERLSGISEEDIEKARRRDAFEKKKAKLVGMNKAKEVPQKAGEELSEHKTVEFHSSESEDIDNAESKPTVSIVIEKAEQHTESESATKVETDTHVFEEETKENAPLQSNPYTNVQRTQSQYQRAAQFSVAAALEREKEQAPPASTQDYRTSANTYAQDYRTSENAEPRVTVNTFTTAKAEERFEEPTPLFKEYYPEKDAEEEKGGLVFEYDEEEIEALEHKEVPPTLNVEVSRITDTEEVCDEDFDEEEEETEVEIDSEYSEEDDDGFDEEEIPPEEQSPVVMGYRDMFSALREEDGRKDEENGDCAEEVTEEDEAVYGEISEEDEEDEPPFDNFKDTAQRTEEKPVENKPKKKADFKNYKTPPMDLMGLDKIQDDEEIYAEINENTRILIETLESFGVTASIKGVDRGPRITRYEVVPAKGVKVKEITHLFSDIELNLATEGIRMEAPIPGKSAIGFEIPNKRPANVRLRELLETDEFINAKSNTYVCIGKDVAGNPVFGDIAKYPHLLVAGATGMGKSVCINSLMISMLYKARPDEVKFIMIDPKKVEFKMYSGIPHLLIPVITESKQAAGALMWAVEEMERRYDLIEKSYVRNIEAYNEKVKADSSFGEYLPKIVIVIDELNDLMMQVRDPVENLIMRIAQKARAAGIHLIIGTQRPSVNVITGTIKANINTRISCKVTSNVDSRTILEMAGAEKLLNKGDMLYKPVDRTKPLRVQGAFVSDPEVEAIMDFLKSQSNGEQYDDEVFAEINRAAQKCNKKGGSSVLDEDDDEGDSQGASYYSDPQFLDAVELAIRSGKISTSLLQRKCSIGYGKAAKYIDMMEEIGVVSEPNGQKPRDILISMDEWHEKLSRVSLDD